MEGGDLRNADDVSNQLYRIEQEGGTLVLPAGLSYNTATRTLSGTPTAKQDPTTYAYTLTLPDASVARLAVYVPKAADVGRCLRAVATYTDSLDDTGDVELGEVELPTKVG